MIFSVGNSDFCVQMECNNSSLLKNKKWSQIYSEIFIFYLVELLELQLVSIAHFSLYMTLYYRLTASPCFVLFAKLS